MYLRFDSVLVRNSLSVLLQVGTPLPAIARAALDDARARLRERDGLSLGSGRRKRWAAMTAPPEEGGDEPAGPGLALIE